MDASKLHRHLVDNLLRGKNKYSAIELGLPQHKAHGTWFIKRNEAGVLGHQ